MSLDSAFRIYQLSLRLDDYLWFASFEWGNDNSTSPILHNYALSFALSRAERTFDISGVPSYEEDLANVDVYATPALLNPDQQPRGIWATFTFNSIDSPTLLTNIPRLGEGKFNDPKYGKRQVLLPGLRFELVAFVRGNAAIPRIVRLGKKRSPIVIESRREINGSRFHGKALASHAVNPLDVQGRVSECVIHSLPPHLVYARALIEDDDFVRDGKHVVHIPARVKAWR